MTDARALIIVRPLLRTQVDIALLSPTKPSSKSQSGAVDRSPGFVTIFCASCEGLLGQWATTLPAYQPRELCKNIQQNMAKDRTPRSVDTRSGGNGAK